MPFVEVTVAGSDVEILEVPKDKIFKIKGVYVRNDSASDAQVVLKDTYTYNAGDSKGTAGERELIRVSVSAGSEEDLTRLVGEEVIGTLVVNTTQTPIYVYVGIEEKMGV